MCTRVRLHAPVRCQGHLRDAGDGRDIIRQLRRARDVARHQPHQHLVLVVRSLQELPCHDPARHRPVREGGHAVRHLTLAGRPHLESVDKGGLEALRGVPVERLWFEPGRCVILVLGRDQKEASGRLQPSAIALPASTCRSNLKNKPWNDERIKVRAPGWARWVQA